MGDGVQFRRMTPRQPVIRSFAIAVAAFLALSVGATKVSPGHWYGLAAPGLPSDPSTITALASALGTAPAVAAFYSQWATATDFPAAAASRLVADGYTPEVTWEPWDPTAGVTQHAYSLAAISSGSFDSYITRWAEQIRSWGHPLRLRFAQEANGNWYPWAEGVNGNQPGSYVAAWRHVHALFARQKVSNVTWVWSPNVPYSGSTALSELYPGDGYVDEVALDGYNWGTTQTWSSWQSFTQVFRAGLVQLTAITAKPATLGEVASTEIGGDKASWITDMFSQLQASYPAVRGFVWFDFDKETDWRISSSTAAERSFASGVRCWSAGATTKLRACQR